MKREKKSNPFAGRLADLVAKLCRRGIAAALVHGEANQKGLVGFGCDNGCLRVDADGSAVFFTDFRYIPAAKREAPWLDVRDMGCFRASDVRRPRDGKFRLGYEGSIPASRYLALKRTFRSAELVDVERDLLLLRAVKTPDEIARVRAAVSLNDRIWGEVRREIRPGQTEKDIQRMIRARMNDLGDGEAFETIVCAGANAAECHHVPDGTVWRCGEPLLVDMGVKLGGYCSDMTRCICCAAGRRGAGRSCYDEIYGLVLSANRAAIAAARPGMTGRQLDAVARGIIRKAGYGRRFGHALGHGVGLEIHELPVASKRSDTVLKPGMLVTIEPGVYIEGDLGVRIEDLVLITEDGCEVLTASPK
jgi:Xaa-Pro aminopeptidase